MHAPDVVLVSPYPTNGERHGGPSGVASYTAALARALDDAGAVVEIVAPAEPGAPPVAADGRVVVRRAFARGARALPDALRAARATGARTVHLQHETFLYGGATSVPGLLPALARLRRSPARGVVTMHHVVSGGVDASFTRLHRVSAPALVARAGLGAVRATIRRFADRVIVHESGFADAVAGASVIPHGVESPVKLTQAEARARLGIRGGRMTVLCFGFVAPYKGLEPALEAAGGLRDDVELVIAGGVHPRLAASGDDYAESLRIAHPHARFTGYVPDPDVGAWFAAADLALFLYPRPVLPRAAAGQHGAFAAAIGVAALLGGGAVAAVALVPSELVGTAFGERYASVAPLAVSYVAAMALFGIARVLVAHRCAQGGGRGTVVLVGAVAAAQALALVLGGDDAGSVATITLGTMAALVLGTALPQLRHLRGRRWPAPGPPTPARSPAPSPVPPPGDRRAIAGVPDWLAVGCVIAVAIAVRLACDRGIWLDEATTIDQAQMPFGQMLDVLRATDVHPPLYFALMWVIAHVAGTSEIVMRAPSLVAGTALVGVLYLLGRELYDRRAGLLAAALGSVAPFVVWYSQEARMYALFMLLAALATLAQVLILRRGGRRYWLMYAATAASLLWTQYFGVLFVGVQQIGFLLAAWSLRRRGLPARGFVGAWLSTGLLIVVAIAPVAPFAIDQFQANQAAGKGFHAPVNAGAAVSDPEQDVPGVYSLLTNFAWGIGGYHSDATMAALTALWPLGMLGGLLALGRARLPMSRLMIAYAVAPALALFVLGFAKPFVFEIRYFAGAVPLLLVLAARGATGWVRGSGATIALSAVLLGTLGVAETDQQLNRSNPRTYDFPGALKQIEARQRPGDVVLYSPAFLGDVITYYAPRLRAGPLAGGVPQRRDAHRVFLLASFMSEERTMRATREGLTRLRSRWHQQGTLSAQQIQVWEFGK